MLVLSRKPGEKICIGDNVVIIVQRLGKGQVSLGIEAPRNIPVLRGELEAHQPVEPADTAETDDTPPRPTLAEMVKNRSKSVPA